MTGVRSISQDLLPPGGRCALEPTARREVELGSRARRLVVCSSRRWPGALSYRRLRCRQVCHNPPSVVARPRSHSVVHRRGRMRSAVTPVGCHVVPPTPVDPGPTGGPLASVKMLLQLPTLGAAPFGEGLTCGYVVVGIGASGGVLWSGWGLADGGAMASWMDELERRENVARERVEGLCRRMEELSQELVAAEQVLSRLAITRETMIEILGAAPEAAESMPVSDGEELATDSEGTEPEQGFVTGVADRCDPGAVAHRGDGGVGAAAGLLRHSGSADRCRARVVVRACGGRVGPGYRGPLDGGVVAVEAETADRAGLVD